MSNERKPKEETKAVEFSIGLENGDFDGVPGVTQLLNPKIMLEKAAAAKAAKEKAAASAPPPKKGATPAAFNDEPLPPLNKPFSLEPASVDFTPPAKPVSPYAAQAKAAAAQTAPTPQAAPVTATPAKPAANHDEGISIDLGGDDKTDPGIVHTSAQPTASSSVKDSGSAAKSLAEMGVHFELQFESERGNYRYTRMRPHGKSSFALWQEKFYFQMKVDLKTLEVQSTFQEFAKDTHPFHEDAFGLTEASHVQVVRLEGDTQKLFVLISEKSLAQDEQKVRDFLSGKGVAPAGNSSGDDDEFKIELAS